MVPDCTANSSDGKAIRSGQLKATMPPEAPIVRVASLRYAYRRHVALHDISFDLGPGVTALLGPNGSGKTTLLKCVLGLLPTEAGTITRDERGRTDGVESFGYVPQSPELPGFSTVHDAVAYAGWLYGMSPGKLDAAAHGILELLGLTDLARRRIRTLSGGQRQRVAIAAGMIHDPPLLVLDEPSAGLDPGQRLRVREAVARVTQARATLLSTHLLEDVRHVADRILVLVNGKVGFDGTVDDLLRVIGPSHTGDLGADFEAGYDALIRTLGGDSE